MTVMVTGTFDIECEGWDKFVLGGCWDGKEYFQTRSLSSLLDYMLERGGTWWGHYAGAYDMLCLLGEHAERRGQSVKCFMAGSRITCASFGKRLILRDSFSLAPIALEKFAQIVGLHKTDPGLPCICGENCEGYCSIRRDMSPEYYRKVGDYMEFDCRILYDAFVYWIQYLRDNFGEPRGTIGSSSFAFTKQSKSKWDSAIYAFVKQAYFGGRTEVWKRESPAGSAERWLARLHGEYAPPEFGGWHDDINSAYIDALRLDMPVGEPRETYREIPRDAKYYVCEAVVTVPESHIPPLPIRGKDRLYYPTGRFFGRWNKTMLEAAIEDGVELHKIGRVVSWSATENPYVEFCNRAWNLRYVAGKDSVKGKLIKQLAVSVCGKLAQRPEIREVIYSPTPMIGYFAIGKSDSWWEKRQFKIADCAYPEHAGVMTGHVQVRVRRRGEAAGDGGVYCDTDGVFGERYNPDGLGEKLGEWLPSGAEKGYDGKYYDMDAPAPKLYRYSELKDEFRAKGFALGKHDVPQRFQAIIAGDEISIRRGVYPLLKSLRLKNRVFERRNERRQFHADAKWCGGRRKVGAIETRPPTIEEIQHKIRENEL